jgi:2-oxoglutarate dehydrogenase E2 component (dihydrolipoamide succinyltransferase)
MCAAQPVASATAQPAAYHGPFLSWTGKSAAPSSEQAPSGPAPSSRREAANGGSSAEFDAWPAPASAQAPHSGYATRAQSETASSRSSSQASGEFSGWPAPTSSPATAPSPRPARYAVAAPAAYAPQAVTHKAAPAPAYIAPRPKPAEAAPYIAPRPRPQPAAVAAYVAPPAPAAVTPPRRHAPPAAIAAAPAVQAPPQAAPQLAQNETAPAANPLARTGVHFYSLHREYGLTPDKIVTPKDRPLVLIGPPDNPPAQSHDDSDDNGGKSDKHGDGEGADD